MLRPSCWVVGKSCLLLLLVSLAANSALAQLETATVSGQVVDPSGLSVTHAQVKMVDIDRDTTTGTATNPSGLYTFPTVRPGRYRMEVTAAGFKVVNVTGLIVNVQDHLEQNFKLALGSVSESVTVEASSQLVNTESATVSTVVDRNFAENLPMNGRSFQTLIELTPGVVLTTSTSQDSGQISVNGQRATSNYFTIDGVSANIGISAVSVQGTLNNGAAGALPGFSVQGGTNSLVSVDALQEFRIQTSTFAPEFGRTPGGQISILTRSGTNQFHGTLFDYLRNDVFDANDWFADRDGLRKPEERQNDFGGTFSGPLVRNRTFLFFSYEGLRLRLPQVAESHVPSLSARMSAQPPLQPFFNAYPVPDPSAPDNSGVSPFSASYSNRSTLDAASLRLDHRISERLVLFARYNYSPSKLAARPLGRSANSVETSKIATQTFTLGNNWIISPEVNNDLRFNYSRVNADAKFALDNFGGAVPLTIVDLGFPSPFNMESSSFALQFFTGGVSGLFLGDVGRNVQRQWNIVDGLSLQRGSHSLKFGADYRRLAPSSAPPQYVQQPFFFDVSAAESGQLSFTILQAARGAALLFQNLGIFAQDTWRITPRVTLTYGLRWDVDFAPSSRNGLNLQAVTNFNNLSQLALAPDGAPIFSTRYGNVAPRVGVAYQLAQRQGWETVLRAGVGEFFDLATTEAGGATNAITYPFGISVFPAGGTFPLDATVATPPPISRNEFSSSVLTAFDPKLRLPYTLQWNVSLEQSLGTDQSVTGSYVGSLGRRLIQTEAIFALPNFPVGAQLVLNAGISDYNALQLQFNRRLSRRLQVLASYTWSHSIDTGSASSLGEAANIFNPQLGARANRGPSDFDIRNAFSAGLAYNVPTPHIATFANAILRGWSLQSIIQARSAPPVDVNYSSFNFNTPALFGGSAAIRPDVVSGQPLYLTGSQCPQAPPAGLGLACPGGRGFNPNAFTPPPADANGNPVRQGDLFRNTLRGFGAVQWDFAVHREFPVHESLKLQFRAEMFNVLNHPNFASPIGDLGDPQFLNPQFGQAIQMLGKGLDGLNQGGGSFSPLYQIGGPRSIQLALKLVF